MPHLSSAELHQHINQAKTKVTIGGTYRHYQRPDQFYTLIDIVMIEATDQVGVTYRAQYDPQITWVRSFNDFVDQVEHSGHRVPRFSLVITPPSPAI